MARKNNKRLDCGLIRVQVYIGKIDGKRKYKSVYGKTQNEAEQKASELRQKIKRGYDITHEDDTFSIWADKWLKNKEVTVSENDYITYSGYRNRFDSLDNKKLYEIKQQDIQDIINQYASHNEHTGKPTAKRTLKGYLTAVTQIFDLAISNRVLEFNPAVGVTVPIHSPKKHRRALTADEQKWILDTPHRMQRAAIIMMYSGLRRGELLPLTWSDINLDEKTISVNKAVVLTGSSTSVKPTAKSRAGLRTVNIPLVLVNFLKDEKRRDIENKKLNILVCPSKKGGIMNSSSWRGLWDDYLLALNEKYGVKSPDKTISADKKEERRYKAHILTIPNITAHWLRHTFATMLYFAGVDVLTARDQLGHENIETTLKIYTHLDQIHKKKNISKLDEYLNKQA